MSPLCTLRDLRVLRGKRKFKESITGANFENYYKSRRLSRCQFPYLTIFTLYSPNNGSTVIMGKLRSLACWTIIRSKGSA